MRVPARSRRLLMPFVRIRARVGCATPARRRSMRVPGTATARTQPALGIEQKHPGCDNGLPRSEAIANLDAVGELQTQRHDPWLEAIAGSHEHMLLKPGIDDRIARHRDDIVSGRFE